MKKGTPKRRVRAKRISVTLRMTPETKRRLDTVVLATGRSQSAEIESLIEQALAPVALYERFRAALAELEDRNPEAAFRKLGYTPIPMSNGTAWLPAGLPEPDRLAAILSEAIKRGRMEDDAPSKVDKAEQGAV
jgi:predicted DNA-binding protein